MQTVYKHFMGEDGFVWFTGVVEDRNDPDALGRVRVRCLGYHSEDLNDIPTKDLLNHVMHSVSNPSMQGLGSSPSFLVEGSWVVGFFMDAKEKQQPMIIGSLLSIPTKHQTTQKDLMTQEVLLVLNQNMLEHQPMDPISSRWF